MLNFINNITPILPIYLFYGASFLFLGVSIAAKDMKGSDLRLVNSLWMLSAFGFSHGAREWLQLGILFDGGLMSFEQIFWMKAVSTFLVVLSFVFLLQFGISLVRELGGKRGRWASFIPLPLFLIWILYFWHFGLHRDGGFRIDLQVLRQANIGARYTFGFVGGMLTAYGLIANSREMKALSQPVSQKIYYAGISFGFYAVFTGLLSPWHQVLGLDVPIVLFRGIAAMFITYFITKGLNIFDVEMRIKYDRQVKASFQTEKLASLGRLAAGVAHEINNPLTNASLGIEALKEAARENGLDGSSVEKLEAVERNIDRASGIAAELLQFSREKESEFAPMDICDAIDGALMLLKYRMMDIVVENDCAPVFTVNGDLSKLERVFINILDNSVDAMPQGGRISIHVDQAGDVVRVRISDSGTGIAQEDLVKVFDPFFTTKEIGKGTGLGLAICYGIVEQHRGAIEMSNNEGAGMTVTVSIPAKERVRESYA